MRWSAWAGVLCLAAIVHAGETVTAELEWEPGFVGLIQSRTYPLSDERPPDLKIPEGIAKPRFAAFLLLGVRVPVVVDPDGNRLFVDANRNGDFTDDPERRWGTWKHMRSVREVVNVPFGDELVPIEFDIRQLKNGKDDLLLYTKIHRIGHVILGGRLRQVALVDGNGDLRFDDPEKDLFFLDIDGDGALQTLSNGHERIRPGQAFRIGTAGFVANVANAAGSKVHFQQARPPPQRPWYYTRWAREEKYPVVKAPQEPLAGVLEAYQGANWDKERIKQLKRVGPYGTDEAFRFLKRVYGSDATKTVRLWALDGMSNPAYRPYEKYVAAIVRDSKTLEHYRRLAIVVLHRMDAKKRISAYRVALKDGVANNSEDLAEIATRYLAEHGGRVARAAIVKAYSDAKKFEVRLAILDQSFRRDPGGPPPKLIELALKDDQSAMVKRGFDALWHADPIRARREALSHNPAREDEFGYIGKQLVRILARAGDKKAVGGVLAICDGDARQTSVALRELRALRSDAARGALVRGLSSKHVHTRVLAARALAAMSADGIVSAVASATKREADPGALESMIEVLGTLRDPKSIPALLKVAKSDAEGRGAAVAALARIGYDDPRVRALFLRLLRSKSWRNRIYGLRAVAATLETAQVGAVVAQLGDSQWQVRSVAIDTLAVLAQKEAILPLIERLDVEPRRRLRFEILRALFRLTARDLGTKTELWRSWWSASGTAHVVPAKPPKTKASNYGTVAKFYSVPIRTDRVVFVIDSSGSMRTLDAKDRRLTRLQVAKTALLAAVDRLGASAMFGVVLFSDKPVPWKESMVFAKPANKDALAKHLAKAEPGGETNLYDSLELALGLRGVDTIVVLSDGSPSVGRYVEYAELLSAVARLNRTGRVQIHAISIGKNSRLLRELARANGGKYYRR